MSNADWKMMMVPVVDSRLQPPMPCARPVNDLLAEVSAAAMAAGMAPIVQLANACSNTHDVVPVGFPQCRTPQQHVNYVAIAWQSSVGTDSPDWGRVRNALDHFGVD
ncbi:MAG: hypothetical protein K8T90_02380 [Planctomycetes bacterium]|nr:hypothetical protein [Planctomycetota bacterium]